LGGSTRKGFIMFFAAEPLFLRRRQNLSIRHQGGSGVMIESGYSKDFHEPS
jgi:hypothetical protein